MFSLHTHRIFLLLLTPLFLYSIHSLHATEQPPEQASAILTLNDCYHLTLTRSERLQILAQEIKAAEARYSQSLGKLFPEISLSGTEFVRNNPTGGRGGGTSFPETTRDDFRLSLKGSWIVFDGFRNTNNLASTSALKSASSYDLARARQLIYLDVADVFYQIISNQADLTILLDLEKALAERVAELEKRITLGKSRRGEKLLARSELAQTRVTIENTHGILKTSHELLAFLIGMPAGTFTLKETASLPKADALAAYLGHAHERPDLLASLQRQRSAERNLSSAKGERLPKVSFTGEQFILQEPDTNRDWNIAVTFELPIFSGGEITANINEEKANLRIAQISLDELRRLTHRDIRIAYHDFITSVSSYLKLEEVIRITRENLDVQKDDYEVGITSNLDVLVSLTRLQNARRDLLRARSQAKLNLIHLQTTTGLPTSSTPPEPSPDS